MPDYRIFKPNLPQAGINFSAENIHNAVIKGVLKSGDSGQFGSIIFSNCVAEVYSQRGVEYMIMEVGEFKRSVRV